MDLKLLKQELTLDEGRFAYPYRDTRGFWTGGIGRNLTAHGFPDEQIQGWRYTGIPESLIDQWYDEDVAAATAVCQKVFPTFGTLSDARQRILVNMVYDLMWEILQWHHLRAAIEAEDWTEAAFQIMDSDFAREAPNRCGRLAARMVNV